MQIQSINSPSMINFKKNWLHQNKAKECSQNFLLPKTTKPYYIGLYEEKEEIFFKNFINKKGKVTIKDYNKIAKKHPKSIVKAYKLIEKEALTQSSPKTIAKAAIKLKEKYDKEYKGKYLIASIGTSPAPICEVMSAIGCDVVFIPASGLKMLEFNRLYSFRDKYPSASSRNENIAHIINYAKRNGINKNDERFLVLLDYCSTGASLDNLCMLFEQENLYEISRMHDHSIASDLSEMSNFKDKNSIFKLEDLANIAQDMRDSTFESISNVPHFYIYNHFNQNCKNSISSENKSSRELYKEFDEYSQPLARAYSLCAIHEAMKIINNIC